MRERTAAVVVNYNDSETTLAQIRRIRDYAALDRIIVVDNASTDRSLAALRAVAGGKVTVLAAKRNGGYGAGNNLGIRYAAKKGIKYALIANPDAEFTASCLAALVAAMRANPALAVLAPVQVNPSHGRAAELPGSRANVLSGAAAFPLRTWLPDLLEAGPVARRLFTPLLHYPKSHYRAKLAPVDCVPGSLLLVDIERFLSARRQRSSRQSATFTVTRRASARVTGGHSTGRDSGRGQCAFTSGITSAAGEQSSSSRNSTSH